MHLTSKRNVLRAFLGALGLLFFGTTTLVIAGLCDHLGKADIALVLGNKVEPDGTPSPRLRARLDETVKRFREGDFPLVVASGGVGKEGYDEAKVMKDYLVSRGIPAEQVIADDTGATTYASARRTAQIMRERKLTSVFVISQYFHIPRTRLALRRFGITTVYAAHARYFELRDLYSAPREAIGYCEYLLRHFGPPEPTAS